MACDSLIQAAKECGKFAKDGVNSDVYLISFADLKAISGSTEVYSTSVTGLVDNIAFATGSTKFVKYGSVANAASIKETYTYADGTGTFDIVKELTFTLANIGSIEAKSAAEKLVSNPVAALVKLGNKTWVAFGLNGGFQAKTMEGSVGTGSNGRAITLSGSDDQFIQVVSPTIITSLIAA